jgi:hypothetical protein
VPRWKAAGYVFHIYAYDHPPLHVHVFKDGMLVARFDLEHQRFMEGSQRRHFGRIRRALQQLKLV